MVLALPILTTDARCHRCAACCMATTIPPFSTVELLQLPSALRNGIARVILSDRKLGGVCSWLDRDTLLCKHYADRPQECRDFAPGSRECKRAIAHA